MIDARGQQSGAGGRDARAICSDMIAAIAALKPERFSLGFALGCAFIAAAEPWRTPMAWSLRCMAIG